MKRCDVRSPVLIALILMLAISVAAQDKLKVSATHGKSVRGSIKGIPVLVLRGTPEERGEAHGVLCARDIITLIDRYAIRIVGSRAYGQRIRPKMKRFSWGQRFEGEMKGMLAGIRKALPSAKDRVIPSVRREIDLTDLKAANTLGDWTGLQCSSFSLWGKGAPDGQVITGRNFDYGANRELLDRQCIIAMVPSKKGVKPTIGVSFMGFIGAITAMNEDGVFMAIHDVMQFRFKRVDLLAPRCLALREALEQADPENAVKTSVALLDKRPTTIGNNIQLCAPAAKRGKLPTAAVLEWDRAGVTTISANKASGFVVCSNHFVRRQKPIGCRRYATLAQALTRHQASNKEITIANARKIVDQAAVSITLHAVVVVPHKRSWSVALSSKVGTSATKQKWVDFVWEDLLGK